MFIRVNPKVLELVYSFTPSFDLPLRSIYSRALLFASPQSAISPQFLWSSKFVLKLFAVQLILEVKNTINFAK
jgi:hypothetical protein